MIRRTLTVLLCAAAILVLINASTVQAQQAFGRQAGQNYNTQDWNRFYHYPYVYYPQNFWGNEYYKSSGDLYHRYPAEMRIPVYNKQWHNYYPQHRQDKRYRVNQAFFNFRKGGYHSGVKYHKGHHFILDTF